MKHLVAIALILTSWVAKSQDRIEVHIPSAKAEADYVWRTIQDIVFFEEHNYQLSLPKGQLMEELIQKAKSNNLGNEDYKGLEKFFTDSIYKEQDYQKGYARISKELSLLNTMINELHNSDFPWGFKTFEVYSVNLTLYGPGGSFDPEGGSLLLFATKDGGFKSYENPSNTIIHEIVHIGIDESIIGKYQVPHTLKERIVDHFVSLNFKQYLPDYRIQDMGEYRIDPYLKEVSDFKDLDAFVQQILNR